LTQKSIFLKHFDPKHSENTLETMINLFIAYKNLKIISKPETKNFSSLDIFKAISR